MPKDEPHTKMIDACRLLNKIDELTLRDHSINYYYRLVEVVHSRLAYIFKHSGGKELKESILLLEFLILQKSVKTKNLLRAPFNC